MRRSKVTDAVLDAVSGHDDSGHSFAPAPLRHTAARRKNSPVSQAQPPAGRWFCDTCGLRGYGGHDLLAHSRNLGHRKFSAMT